MVGGVVVANVMLFVVERMTENLVVLTYKQVRET